MSEVKKRFIAGAVCPRCATMDSVRMYRDDEREYRECVKCGFEDSLRIDGRQDVPELETRVTEHREEEQKVQAQTIQFHPNPGAKRRDH